jgi:hypothetical protein
MDKKFRQYAKSRQYLAAAAVCAGAGAMLTVVMVDLLDADVETEQTTLTVPSSAASFSDSFVLAQNEVTGETIVAPLPDLPGPKRGVFPLI